MKTMSYFDFKHLYYKKYPSASYRLGQAFLCCFMKDSSKYHELWNEEDNSVAENMIYKLILDYNWDMMSLHLLNKELL
tara:strand:+ start:71698 stop:71931 length:234 start_codon:yes stop_codon:yes gene_type:complete